MGRKKKEVSLATEVADLNIAMKTRALTGATKREKLLGLIRKKFGGRIIGQASQSAACQPPKRLEFAIPPLDINLGGGVPIGRVSMLTGLKSSCKTALALRLISRAQRTCALCYQKLCLGCKCGSKARPMVAIFIDCEGTWANDWSTKLGVDNDLVYVIQSEYAEQAIDVADAALRTGEFDLLVIDSIAALTPQVEIVESMSKQLMGVAARMMNRGVRKWQSSINRSGVESNWKPTILLINQVRKSLTPYGPPNVRPGGMGQDFATSLIIELSGKGFKGVSEKSDGVDSAADVVNVRAKIEKSKVCRPRGEIEFQFWLRDIKGHKVGQVDDAQMLLDFARKYRLLDGKYHLDGKDYKSGVQAVAYLNGNEAALERLRAEVYGAASMRQAAGVDLDDTLATPEEIANATEQDAQEFAEAPLDAPNAENS